MKLDLGNIDDYMFNPDSRGKNNCKFDIKKKKDRKKLKKMVKRVIE